MEKDPLHKRDEALSFLVDHETGVLATLSSEGKPRARLLYYTCDDSFNLYFISLANTRKADDLAHHSSAAFVVSEMEVPRTIQLEGDVEDITETATMNPLLVQFIERLMSHGRYGIPLERFDASVLKLYKFTPNWIRWGDFSFGRGTDNVFTDVSAEEISS